MRSMRSGSEAGGVSASGLSVSRMRSANTMHSARKKRVANFGSVSSLAVNARRGISKISAGSEA